jgi:signal transduction histidine kinase
VPCATDKPERMRSISSGPRFGLALVNRFVELHNGWVEIESEHGTLVRCHFPRRLHERGAGKPDDEQQTA